MNIKKISLFFCWKCISERVITGLNVAKISADSRKLVQPKRTIKQNVLRGKMSISTSG